MCMSVFFFFSCQHDFAALLLEKSIGQCVDDESILPLPHMETFSNDLTYMLECIVANPSLYDKENSHFNDEDYKFKVWNEVCGIYYDERECFFLFCISIFFLNR